MEIFYRILALLILFTILGKSAEIVVKNVKKITKKIGIPIFVLGMVLGLFTTLPEGAIAINSTIDNIPELSFGNLMGGIIFIFCFIFGLNLLLNKKIRTDGKIKIPLIIFGFMFLPVILGFKGYLSLIDGLAILALYPCLLYLIYKSKNIERKAGTVEISKQKISKEIFITVICTILILLSSHFIVEITEDLLVYFKVSAFTMGILLISIGTNLPDLTVTITAWRKKSSTLSISHLFGSGIANILVLGLLASTTTINTPLSPSYIFMAMFLIITFIAIIIFYKTNKRFDRSEGYILIGIYLIFVFTQIFSASINRVLAQTFG